MKFAVTAAFVLSASLAYAGAAAANGQRADERASAPGEMVVSVRDGKIVHMRKADAEAQQLARADRQQNRIQANRTRETKLAVRNGRIVHVPKTPEEAYGYASGY